MRSIMLSMPVRNLEVSRAFFAELGFTFSPQLSGRDSACMVIGDNAHVVLLAEERFRDGVNGDITSAGEVLICLSVDSEQEVDEIVTRAIVAGGKPWPVVEERPVYSGSFQDPDGHLWQVTCPPQSAQQETAEAGTRIAA